MDGYSAFLDLDGKTHTGLEGYLARRGIKRVFLAGLADGLFVMWSAPMRDKLGFEAAVIEGRLTDIDVGDHSRRLGRR